MTVDDVTAVLVTRGDVNLQQVTESLPYPNVVVWNNAERPYDAGVFGRYAALAEVRTPLVFFQDDDCIVWNHEALLEHWKPGHVIGNVLGDDPARVKRYHDTTLLGWGSLFEKDLPWAAFQKYARYHPFQELLDGLGAEIVFPMLTPTKTLYLNEVLWLYDDGPVYRRDNRMWMQPGFYAQLDDWMARARAVRDRGGLA